MDYIGHKQAAEALGFATVGRFDGWLKRHELADRQCRDVLGRIVWTAADLDEIRALKAAREQGRCGKVTHALAGHIEIRRCAPPCERRPWPREEIEEAMRREEVAG